MELKKFGTAHKGGVLRGSGLIAQSIYSRRLINRVLEESSPSAE
jgi:hypothetical protein